MASRTSRLAIAAVLQLAALVLGHQLVYLARYGSRFGEELVHSGHGDAWAAAVLTSAVLAVFLAVAGVARLLHLGLLVRRSHGSAVGTNLSIGSLAGEWLALAPRITILQLVLLTTQENLERVAIGRALPGPGILLSPEYAGGAWIAIAVALAVSFVAALFTWRRRVLLARLRAARASLPRGRRPANRPVMRQADPVESILGRRSALRAPPSMVAA